MQGQVSADPVGVPGQVEPGQRMDLLQPVPQLTGLDLGRHEDRMRADLALRLLQVNAGLDEEDALPWGQ